MSNFDQRFNLPADFLYVAFFVLLRFYVQSEEDELLPLVSFERDDISWFWRSIRLDDEYKQGKIENLIQSHVNSSADFISLQALPFLPDDSLLEFSRAGKENQESWQNFLMTFPSFFSDLRVELNQNNFEEIDYLFLTFIEWVNDVEFLKASELERSLYMREFPFLSRNGVC